MSAAPLSPQLRQHRHTATWILALVVFGATLFSYRPRFDPDDHINQSGYESLALAESLAHHGTYADPFWSARTGSSALVPPAYPAFAAIVIKRWGDGPGGALALKWAAALTIGLQLALLPFFARSAGMEPLTGVFAAAAWLFARFPLYHVWENTYAGTLIVILSFLMCDRARKPMSRWRGVLLGLIWGLLLLMSPSATLVLLLWLFLLKARCQRKLVVLGVALIVIAPWLIRNYRVFGEFTYVRDNLGLELAVSNNSCASFAHQPSGVCFALNHPDLSMAEAEKVARDGEVQYNHRRMREALLWIGGHPAQFVALTGKRFLAFWVPPSVAAAPEAYGWKQSVSVAALTLLSIPGVVFLFRRQRDVAIVLLCWLAAFPPVYYFVKFDARYRQPILWISCLCGCYFVFEFLPQWLSLRNAVSRNQSA